MQGSAFVLFFSEAFFVLSDTGAQSRKPDEVSLYSDAESGPENLNCTCLRYIGDQQFSWQVCSAASQKQKRFLSLLSWWKTVWKDTLRITLCVRNTCRLTTGPLQSSRSFLSIFVSRMPRRQNEQKLTELTSVSVSSVAKWLPSCAQEYTDLSKVMRQCVVLMFLSHHGAVPSHTTTKKLLCMAFLLCNFMSVHHGAFLPSLQMPLFVFLSLSAGMLHENKRQELEDPLTSKRKPTTQQPEVGQTWHQKFDRWQTKMVHFCQLAFPEFSSKSNQGWANEMRDLCFSSFFHCGSLRLWSLVGWAEAQCEAKDEFWYTTSDWTLNARRTNHLRE